MTSAFNAYAVQYDDHFTNSPIGKCQRKQVWDFLHKRLNGKRKLNILELNCGTGFDANVFQQEGHNVVATDISEEMIEVAKRKNVEVDFRKMDMRDLSDLQNSTFDLIFSNFGGMNCLKPNEINMVIENMKGLLTQNGRIITVVMPRFCINEIIYFLLKLNFRNAFRRLRKNGISVEIENQRVQTYYYSTKDLKRILNHDEFKFKSEGIGFFVPPSYLNPLFSKAPFALKFLQFLDSIFSRNSITANWSDHFILEAKKR